MKHIAAVVIFALAIVLQLWFSPGGMRGDFVLTTLIVLSFLFSFPELLVFVLLAVVVVNPFPWLSLDMTLLALIPLATHIVSRWFALDVWIGGAISIVLGILLFYLGVAPHSVLSAPGFFMLDIVVCVAFGELIFWGMENLT